MERSGRSGVRAAGARVDELLEAFDRPMPPALARAKAEELVRELVQFYGAGLERVLEIVDESAGAGAQPAFAALCDDPFASGLMTIHGLHPLEARERVLRALERVRPYVESHRGSIELLSVDESVVTLRMSGSCDGCPSSEVTLKLAIEKAIFDACPDIAEVRAENAPPAAAPSSLRVLSDWIDVDGLGDLGRGGLAAIEVSGMPVLVMRVGGETYAYRNRCPGCTLSLETGELRDDLLACASCGNRFDVVRAGRPLDGSSPLEPYPIAFERGRLQLAIPLTA